MEGGNPMRQQNVKYFLMSFLAVLFVGIGFWGCTASQIPDSESPAKIETAPPISSLIPVRGAITHLHESDKKLYTVIDIVIGDNFQGTLPDDIDSITVTGPQGKLALGKSDFNYHEQFRDFWISIPGAPETGSYTFTVTSGKRRGSATDTQLTLKTIPIPDIRTFSPAAGETITAKPPYFSWQAVEADAPLYYRLDIKDMQDNYVFRTDYVRDMFSVHAPSKILTAGQTYRWRVRVADGADWIELNNRSQNQWQQIRVAQTVQESDYAYRVPVEINDGWQ